MAPGKGPEAGYAARMLEVNCGPSLAVDSTFPIVGPHAAAPAGPAPGAPGAALWWAALREMPYRGARQCLCRAHHRPHLHAPCAVDLQAKLAAVGGALRIVRRQQRAAEAGRAAGAEEVCDGTAYSVVVEDGELRP